MSAGQFPTLTPRAVKRMVGIGTDPWRVRELNGTVRFKRVDAALDFNGYPAGLAGAGQEIKLQPTTIYYLIARWLKNPLSP